MAVTAPMVEPATLFPVTAADTALTTDEWYTPRWLFKAAGLVFDLDVCAPVAPEFRTCPARRFLTVVEDGLTAPWEGLVWCNPPYSAPRPWVDRWVTHPDGLALFPASPNATRGQLVAHADAIALITINDNIRRGGFLRPDGTMLGYPIALVLAARGALALTGLARVAAADQHCQGAYHVRP